MNKGVAIVGLAIVGGIAATMVVGTVGVVVYLGTRTRYGLELVQVLSEDQRRMAGMIAEYAHAMGLPASIAGALVANAYAESRLNPTALGDVDGNGVFHAAGLFQLNDATPTAMGRGMSLAARQDPATNISKFLSVLAGPEGAAVRQAALAGSSIADLAALVSRDLEKPRDTAAEMVARRTYAIRLFGERATTNGLQVDYTTG